MRKRPAKYGQVSRLPGSSKFRRAMLNSIAWLIGSLVLLVVAHGSAAAQQVCYSYDGLGRLTGVIDQNSQAAFYDYDAVGTILSIRRQSPSGPVTIYAFDPPWNAPGGSVEICGCGFSATPNQNQVTIGGTPATVSSALPCTLIVQVPANAATGQITVAPPLGQATSSSPFLVSGLVVGASAAAALTAGTLKFNVVTKRRCDPAVVCLVSGLVVGASAAGALTGGTIQFTVLANGCGDPALLWRVNGIVGGSSTVGA